MLHLNHSIRGIPRYPRNDMVVNEIRVSAQAKACGYIFTLYQANLKPPREL
jgi:hypothetical protein